MKENEPKVKYSDKFWEKCRDDITYPHEPVIYGLPSHDRATYDRLVSLEAKIELMKKVNECYNGPLFDSMLRLAESELAQLVKELKL